MLTAEYFCSEYWMVRTSEELLSLVKALLSTALHCGTVGLAKSKRIRRVSAIGGHHIICTIFNTTVPIYRIVSAIGGHHIICTISNTTVPLYRLAKVAGNPPKLT